MEEAESALGFSIPISPSWEYRELGGTWSETEEHGTVTQAQDQTDETRDPRFHFYFYCSDCLV